MEEKQLVWVGSSKKDLLEFPDNVIDVVGYALDCAQFGEKHLDVKPLTNGKLQGKGIFEVVENYDGDTYRAVYTVKLKERIYVLHSFKKKSKKGIATPHADIELINNRYREAKKIHEELDKVAPKKGFAARYLGKYFPDAK